MIPTYPEQDCKISGPCSEVAKNVCADCQTPIPNFDNAKSSDHRYRNMGGNGFQSCTSNHNHFRNIKGSTGMQPVRRELCVDCYLLDFAKQYPDAELPANLTRKV